MTGLTWILTLLCVSGCHLSSASPVLHSAQVAQVGQNVSLTCNLSSSTEITWYLLRSDQLLPLLTIRPSKIQGYTMDVHTADNSRINNRGDLESGLVSLEILQVEEKDAGVYFCTGRCTGALCVNRGIYLTVNGVYGESDRDKMKQPCWSLGICILPGLLTLCFIFVAGFYLCSGKPVVCCCNSGIRDSALRVTEEEALHYSSLKHANKARLSGRRGMGLVEEDVTYSTVASCKKANESHDHRSE